MTTPELTKLTATLEIKRLSLVQIGYPVPELDIWKKRIMTGIELDEYADFVRRNNNYDSATHYMCSVKKVETGSKVGKDQPIVYAFVFYGRE